VNQVVFNTNHEAELPGECVPKPELGNEEQRLHSAKVLQRFYFLLSLCSSVSLCFRKRILLSSGTAQE